MSKPLLHRIAAAGLLVALGLAASGCNVIDSLAHHQKSASFDDVATLEAEGDLNIPWLPDDSSEIRVTQSTEADDATVAVSSAAALDEELCTEVSRRSAPAYTIDDTVDVYAVDSVFACGEWSVAQTPSGWLGWTPNHPDEETESPSA